MRLSKTPFHREVSWTPIARYLSHAFIPSVPSALFLCALAFFTACSTTPRIQEVWSQQRLQIVGSADEQMFLQDQATMMVTKGKFLPRDQQGEEFYVAWSGAGIDQVKFQYRQVYRPDVISEKTFVPSPASHQHTLFAVLGDEHFTGGAVSAWRVTLWHDGQLLTEQHSSVW